MLIAYNKDAPRETPVRLPDIHTYPRENWKYAPLARVWTNSNSFVRAVLDTVPLTNNYRRVLVDVKVQNLTPDMTSCIPGWHLDGAFEDTHHLFIHGGAPTEFIDQQVLISSGWERRELVKQIPTDVVVKAIPTNTICTFTGRDFHRGVRAPHALQRLLIRVTETNTILGSTTPRDPSRGARKDMPIW